MPSHDQALASLISQLALSFDGAVLGLALAYAAVRSFMKFSSSTRALRKIKNTPTLKICDLRALLSDLDSKKSGTDSISSQGETELVLVTGQVEAKSVADGGNWKSLRPSVLVAQVSGDKAVIVQRSQTCIYNEWRGIFGWTSDLRTLLGRSWREQESSSMRMVPFVLVEEGRWSQQSDYVEVNMDGSKQPLPLVTVYHHLQPVDASPYTFLQALFGHEYPVGLLDEEKILPLGKTVTAIGVCRSKDGVPEMHPCADLPYFLSDMTKGEMVADLAYKTKILMWSGAVLGSISIGILGFAIFRNWNRWKQWRQQRNSQRTRQHTPSNNVSETLPDDEVDEVPEGQLCVICLMRRRRSAFIPCGHMVCCHACALSVEGAVLPKCPLCRQSIQTSVRIFQC